MIIKMRISSTIKKSKLRSKCKFLNVWLESKNYNFWFGKSKSPYISFFWLFVKDIGLRTMGYGALDSHAECKVYQINSLLTEAVII